MLQLSRRTLLAIEAVLDVAYNSRVHPVQAHAITERQGTSKRYLEQILQVLVHHNILKSVRGAKGGYVLAKERRKITLGEIVRIVGANEDEGSPYQVSQSDLGRQVVVPVWKTAEDKMLAYLDTITLDTMCIKAQKQEIKRPFNKVTDFTI